MQPIFDKRFTKTLNHKNYSNDTRKDHAVTHGANTNDTKKNAPINDKCAAKSTPAILASTAPKPQNPKTPVQHIKFKQHKNRDFSK